MTIHKEGIPTIILSVIFSSALLFIAYWCFPTSNIAHLFAISVSAFLLITVLQFFRHPSRKWHIDAGKIISPADGKIVVIEETVENEFFKDKRIQISVFMSPTNVHVNRYPISGKVELVKYHAGKFLVAYDPKSSTDNERTTVVVKHNNGSQILFRQIAGALARRIVFYCKEGDEAKQSSEFGFIKFGSRVDIFLPLNAKVFVSKNQVVRGGITPLAKF